MNADQKSLQEAICAKDHEGVVALLSQGVDLDFTDSTKRSPMHHAAASGDSAVVWLLLGRKASIYGRTREDETVVHMAVGSGSRRVVQLIAQADLAARSARPENRPPGMPDGRLIDQKDAQGDAPVHRAARLDSAEVLELLIAERADIETTDALGRTAIEIRRFKLAKQPVGEAAGAGMAAP